MNCPNCGAPAVAGGFCGGCGKRVPASQPAQPGTINLDMDGEGPAAATPITSNISPRFPSPC